MSEENSVIEIDEETQIRPYKWSAWDFEIFSRERGGKTEYAFITIEHKWVDLDIEGDYVLVPIEQHKLLAPLFKETTASTDLMFVIDGLCGIGWCDGGYPSVDFYEPHLKTEYDKIGTEQQECGGYLSELDKLEKMGFEEYEDKMQMSDDSTRRVVKFNKCQRKLGE